MPPPARHTTGGRAVSLPPAGCARGNQQSTAAAVLESTKVTPILDLFRTRNNAEISVRGGAQRRGPRVHVGAIRAPRVQPQ